MIETAALARMIVPEKTSLFLGAGASVPSGAPTGAQLAYLLCERLAKGEKISDDLTETASILENRYTRPRLIEEVRKILRPLEPTGGLLTLPEFNWGSVYTTNYDYLIEGAYRKSGKSINVIRSNFDWARTETGSGVIYYKIHGCLSQDIADGHNGRMVLTERDYEEYASYKELLFDRLSLDLQTRDVLFIGYSLKDPHLRKEINYAVDMQQKKHAPGRILALIYQPDPDRAQLLERRGITVAFGGINEFFHSLIEHRPVKIASSISSSGGFSLPPELRPCTLSVEHELSLPSNAKRLYNGSAASYADIKAGITFQRSCESAILEDLATGTKRYFTAIGAAGVGKTTLARRLLNQLVDKHEFMAWEHNVNFPFHVKDWLSVEKSLRELERPGILLIDDCPTFLHQVNSIVDALSRIEQPALSVVVTANNNQWYPRRKSAHIFSSGTVYKLSSLTDFEIEQIINLTDSQDSIKELVGSEFGRLSRSQKIQRLRSRCSADMFVCLKNIFGNDLLDNILLREYKEMDFDLQKIYKHVSALEAAGARVHRQLILRLLDILADDIPQILNSLEGIIRETPIDEAAGLYGWATRHEAIAEIIARYKFSEQKDIYDLFARVIDGLNPAVWLELRTLRGICGREYGIGMLSDVTKRIELYERIIQIAPGERVPRHRLISSLINNDSFEQAAVAIKSAEENVHFDSVISRYKVKLAIQQAQTAEGIMPEDRIAKLREAERIALHGLSRLKEDKYAYIAYADVGVALAQMNGDMSVLDTALVRMEEAVSVILDPQLTEEYARVERVRNQLRVHKK